MKMNRFRVLILFVAVLGVCFCLAFSAAPKASVLIIHDELPQMEVLSDFLTEKGDLDVMIVEQQSLPDDLSAYKAVIVFIHGKLFEKTEKAVIDYTINGGKLICLHHSISSGKSRNKFYFDFLGVQLDKGTMEEGGYKWEDGSWMLVNLNSKHPITNNNVNWEKSIAYTSSDSPSVECTLPAITLKKDSEVFVNHKYTDAREKTVLCGLVYKDPATGKTYMQDRTAWLKKQGKGSIFYFMPGHSVSDYKNENIAQIILNAIK
jgi:hypothetical protein